MNETVEACSDEPPDETDHFAFCTTDEEDKGQDFFAGLYESPYIKLSMTLTYGVALICMVGLGFVLWFERSGQAGQYRTLVNQLSSFNLDQVLQNKICGIVFCKYLCLRQCYSCYTKVEKLFARLYLEI